jgi:hypothetical protein
MPEALERIAESPHHARYSNRFISFHRTGIVCGRGLGFLTACYISQRITGAVPLSVLHPTVRDWIAAKTLH